MQLPYHKRQKKSFEHRFYIPTEACKKCMLYVRTQEKYAIECYTMLDHEIRRMRNKNILSGLYDYIFLTAVEIIEIRNNMSAG